MPSNHTRRGYGIVSGKDTFDQIKTAASKFSGIYENNIRSMTIGQRVPQISEGLEAGGTKRTKLRVSGTYSSSTGSNSVDLIDNADPKPYPVPCLWRPMGQKGRRGCRKHFQQVCGSPIELGRFGSVPNCQDPSVEAPVGHGITLAETTDPSLRKIRSCQMMKRNMRLPIDGDAC
ncbi:uncharacterized protein LOC125213689 [Salvia hispanica]|uniref:uncharacterized protein LOC125213689 n=1 Tax=Salvia hispanica TaxID=49212 RepID=UPI00200965E1|nr:uncharacterized protein LOC125213689 [Salvia hispanica]